MNNVLHYGRQAYGSHRRMSDAQKAQYVAESILLHEAEGHQWTIHQFGLDVEGAQWQRVLAALETLRQREAAQLQRVA